jgi:predicted nucleic acid-binding protein
MIGNNDLCIAAHALAAGFVLVTNNEKELRRASGLYGAKLGGIADAAVGAYCQT